VCYLLIISVLITLLNCIILACPTVEVHMLLPCSDYRCSSIEYITVSALCACVGCHTGEEFGLWRLEQHHKEGFWSLDFCSSVLVASVTSLLSLLKKLSRRMRSPCCLCNWEFPPPMNFCMPEPIFMKLDMNIMASEPISTVNFINSSHQSACLYVYPIVARQRLGKNVTAETNTQANIGNLLDESFSMQSVSYQRRTCGFVCVSPYRF
jgi:hypothetical protein